MTYFKKSGANFQAAIFGMMAMSATAVWQFYLFAIFKDANGIVVVQGGTSHLWRAMGATLFACVASLVVSSILVQHDKNDVMRITM